MIYIFFNFNFNNKIFYFYSYLVTLPRRPEPQNLNTIVQYETEETVAALREKNKRKWTAKDIL
jgi:hypothetical protein